MSSGQTLHIFENALRALHITKLQVFAKAALREPKRPIGNHFEDAKLRGESKAAIGNAIEERFLSQSVPRQHQPLSALIPKRKSKHPSQLVKHLQPPKFI